MNLRKFAPGVLGIFLYSIGYNVMAGHLPDPNSFWQHLSLAAGWMLLTLALIAELQRREVLPA